MYARILILFTMIGFILFAPPASAWTEELTMDTLPEDQGWTLYDDSTGSSTVDSGILNIQCDYFRFYRAPTQLWDDEVSNAAGWIIEFRMRIVEKGFCYYYGDVGIWITDDVRTRIVCIDPDRLYVAFPWYGNDPPYVLLDATQWHDYRLAGLGDRIWITIDGMLEMVFQDPFVGEGSPGLYFGDLGSDVLEGCYSSNTDWDYLRFETAVPVAAQSTTWGQVRSLFR